MHINGDHPHSVQDPSPNGSLGTSRRQFLSTAGLSTGALIAAGSLAACGTARTGNQSKNGTGRSGTAGETLFVATGLFSAPTSFNPLGTSAAWPANNVSQLLYESLVRFNLLDGSLTPGLGTQIEESRTTLTVPLQHGTKWSDGQDLTADDVVFTFDIAKDHALGYSTIWNYAAKIEATDDRTVVFSAKRNSLNLPAIKALIASTFIVPKHIWKDKAGSDALVTESNLKPVGSGPFLLDKFDQSQVALRRNDSYWGKTIFGTPPMKAIVNPIFKGNEDYDLKLASGDLDVSDQFTTEVWKMWEDQKKPVGTWLKHPPYHLPGDIPMLVFNTTKPGLDNPKVRRAIAYCIDYANLAQTAMSNYSDTVSASLILPTGSEKKFFDAAAVKKNGWTYDPDRAREILEKELHASKGHDGIYVLPDGTKLGGWTAQCPTGWTDWDSALEIVAKNAREVGIGISTRFPQAPQWTQAMGNGNFDMVVNTYSGVSPATPWARFRDALDIRGIPGLGKQAFSNFGRYRNSKVAQLLDTAGAATSDTDKRAALTALDAIMREDVPVIPLMYRPLEFYEFNTSTWTNFPTAENPYAPPMLHQAGIEWYFKIKKAGR